MAAADDFLDLLLRPAAEAAPAEPGSAEECLAALPPELLPALRVLAAEVLRHPGANARGVRPLIETVRAQMYGLVCTQVNAILHHPELQAMEASWRGVHYLVRNVATDA